MLNSLYSLSTTDTFFYFFFNDTATTEIYTLSLHDALPIYPAHDDPRLPALAGKRPRQARARHRLDRSEEHTSELQSHSDLVCRLLLEKKKNNHISSCDSLQCLDSYTYYRNYRRAKIYSDP